MQRGCDVRPFGTEPLPATRPSVVEDLVPGGSEGGGCAWRWGADQPQPAYPRSVRPVGVCLVIRRDRLFRDAAIAGELESGAERSAPDFGCAGLPPRTGDLGARLPRPGDPDGLADELSGPPRPLHGKVVEHGAGKLAHWPAWPLAVQRAHGLGELFQAEDTGRVIEQAYWGTRRHLTTLASRRTSPLGNVHFSCPVRRSAGHTGWCHARWPDERGRVLRHKVSPLDAEQLRKALWTLCWRGTAQVRERAEDTLSSLLPLTLGPDLPR